MITLPADAFEGVDFESAATARMRDGVRLIADIYRPRATPENPGPWPVLLMRQPYGRDIASTVVYAHPTWFARRGFIVVIQDVRGRGDSEGVFYAFRNETEDGHDTVMWAAALPGSNGRVGMYGFSYQGSTQLLAALAKPPPLRALAPHMTAFDLHSGWFYRDRLLQLSTSLTWANQMLREDARRAGAKDAADALDASWTRTGELSARLPVADPPLFSAKNLPTYGRDWLSHPEPGGYWDEFDLLKRIQELDLPVFHVSGWYDLYLRGSIDGYSAMARTHKNQFLLAAPWVHIPWGRHVGPTDLGEEAIPQVDEMLAKWFHHWLDEDAPQNAAPLAGCRYFILGENRWRQEESWPPRSEPTIWHLASGGRANSCFGDGRLTRDDCEGPDDLFNYDPETPVLAPGGNQGGHAGFGPFDLAPQQQSNALLVYTSSPLKEPVTVAGQPSLRLWFQSSAEETAVVARLSRVRPDGRALFLSLGAVVVAAKTTTEVSVKLDHTAVRFEAGDRIRIDVASSAFPLLIRHPNRKMDPASIKRPSEFARALQIVRHTHECPSALTLPILPS